MFSTEILDFDDKRAIKVHDVIKNLGIIAIDEGNSVGVEQFWEMCISIYKQLGYQNDTTIKIKGMSGGTVKLKLRIGEDVVYKE